MSLLVFVSRFRCVCFALVIGLFLSACSPSVPSRDPLVKSIKTQQVAPPAAAQKLVEIKAKRAREAGQPTSTRTAPAIFAEVSFSKDALLARSFLYGSDLQYSTIAEEGDDLILQAMALGHTPVKFRIIGSRLQMLADQTHLFESDINHPERLIHEFPIVNQSPDTVTIEISKASPVMNTVLDGEKANPVRTSWVRSVELSQDGRYLMFETSVETADGSIAEFMESFFPRDAIVPLDAKALLATPDFEPFAERYRLLSGEELYLDLPSEGRQKVLVAARYHGQPGTVIDWYVTSNIPADLLPILKAGVEGWNRYSQKMWGTDIVSFKGVLPAGTKIGDPRYNVISWDSVEEAGAAYESQAYDPITGIQSHSLVYLPKAWINIGKEYWENGSHSDASDSKRLQNLTKRGKFVGRSLPVKCFEDAASHVSLEARVSPEEFGKELLKGVILHEVGHALGLDHNFKGSLDIDMADPKAFSSSIMDYNQYQIERHAFDSLESANGPILEYDRQILSVLYNGGKDVVESDPVLPACSDPETELDGGADPLCIPYDAGADPTARLLDTVKLVKDRASALGSTRSLALAIEDVATSLPDASSVTTSKEASDALKELKTVFKGTVKFYYYSGAQSLAVMARNNIGSLRAFRDSVLPASVDEVELRKRAAEGIDYASTVETFEPSTVEAFKSAMSGVRDWLKSTAYVSGLDPAEQDAEIQTLLASFDGFETDLEKTVTSETRTRLYARFTASDKAPFYFLSTGPFEMDFERSIARTLLSAATEKLGSGRSRPVEERIAAAESLKTFEKSAVGFDYVTDAATRLQAEAKNAKTMQDRVDATKVLAALKESK